jgi:hypothetical protein
VTAQAQSSLADGIAAACTDASPACAACGYSLRGLSNDGKCPECGHDIAASLRVHAELLTRRVAPIALSPAKWVRKQALGCAFLIVAPWFMVSTTFANIMNVRQHWGYIIVWVGYQLLMIAALWLLGTADPAGPGLLGTSRWRRWTARALRPAAVAFVAFSLLEVLMFTLAAQSMQAAYRSWSAGHNVLSAGISIVVLAHLSTLSGRLARRRLSVAAITLAILLPEVFALQWLFLEMIFITPSSAWVMVPRPVFGHVEAWVIVPYSLLQWPRMNVEMAAWIALMLLSIAAWVVVLRVWMALHRASTNEG